MADTVDISGLVRANILHMKPYTSARDEYSGAAKVFMDANENPFNSPLNRYPDPRQTELKRKIAGIDPGDQGDIPGTPVYREWK